MAARDAAIIVRGRHGMRIVGSDEDVEGAMHGRPAIDMYTELKSVCMLI
jgi:hypothetical protein